MKTLLQAAISSVFAHRANNLTGRKYATFIILRKFS